MFKYLFAKQTVDIWLFEHYIGLQTQHIVLLIISTSLLQIFSVIIIFSYHVKSKLNKRSVEFKTLPSAIKILNC